MRALDFAPAPHRLDHRRDWAVPIDIERVTARLDFDVRRQSVRGRAALTFRHGIRDGFPLFDLRQPVQRAALDGTPLDPAADLAHRRFGRRAEESLRLLRVRLAEGSRHRLALDYSLASPPLKSSAAGGYQPALRWEDASAVHFNFGFTDLGGGRYLEAWIPANLIYDTFALSLEVRVTGTRTPHVLITNGEVTRGGLNHWKVRYPATFTALSPLLQLHPAGSIESHGASVTLPVSRRRVAIETHKFRASEVSLEQQAANIARWLAHNEAAIGPYHHGSRYVAFLHRGGMEYDGACTAEPAALEHEVFHSWWARGLKPATQNDGWIDEAWTTYHDDRCPTRRAFDFTEPADRLCPGSPWNRATPRAAYRQGSRFFEGLAVHLGADALHAIMREIYRLHAPGLIGTAQLVTHFLDRTANDATIRRAFRHYVYR